MNIHQASVTLSFDKTQSGLVSVKLRISYQRDRRRFSFPIKEGVLIAESDFERLNSYHRTQSKRTAEDIKKLYELLKPYIDRAEQICSKLIPFSFDGFKESFYNNSTGESAKTDVIALLDQKAAKLDAEGHIGNANNYTASARSFERFAASLSESDRKALLGTTKPTPLLLSHITAGFLARYERWMYQYGKAPRKPGGNPTPAGITTISIYCRNLRAVYNEAIDAGLIGKETYPFTKKGYVIPASANTKKALGKDDVLRIIAYQPGSVAEQFARDFWVFSYLSNGMNMADIFRLRWKDLNLADNTLTFIRQKTTTTRKAKQVKVVATLFPESLAILERWASLSRMASDYVFPNLSDQMSPRRQKMVLNGLLKQINKYMARIADNLGITDEVNTYAARHSFATILLRSEAPVAFISQSLGHTSLKTTEDYLGSFEDEQTKKYLKNLL